MWGQGASIPGVFRIGFAGWLHGPEKSFCKVLTHSMFWQVMSLIRSTGDCIRFFICNFGDTALEVAGYLNIIAQCTFKYFYALPGSDLPI